MITGVIAGLLLLVGGGATWLGVHYQNHALPGVSIAGEPVGGMTEEQVTDLLESELDDATIQIDGLSEPTEIALAEAGVTVDIPATVDEVFAPNADFANRYVGLFEKIDVEPVVTVSQDDFDTTLKALDEDDAITEAVNGEVTFDAEANTFSASESRVGTQIDGETLLADLETEAKTLAFEPVTVDLVEFQPEYSSESAQEAAVAANAWMAKEIYVVDREGVYVSPEIDQRAEWVSFEVDGDNLSAGLNKDAVSEWVGAVAKDSAAEPVSGIRNVDSSGTVVAVAFEGTDGFSANNVEAISDQIVDSFGAVEEPLVEEFTYDVVEHDWEEREIAKGTENLAYQAAPGEKWIDINLSTFTASAYEGADKVLSAPMVAGAPEYGNPTGQWSVYAKVPSQTMRGDNHDGSKYETPNVPWILYYNGGYALHGAYWRSQFGYDAGSGGSHGCINLPVGAAKDFYDWASVGNVVVVHH